MWPPSIEPPLTTTRTYDPATGRLTDIASGAGGTVQNQSYDYDSLGNLTGRSDANVNVSESFGYDAMNRLISSSGSGVPGRTISYNAIGNITAKSDVGSYSYGAKPHAVASVTGTVNGVVNPSFAYDANGNLASGAGRTLTWSSFDMPVSIAKGAATDSFLYGPEHQRIRQTNKASEGRHAIPRRHTAAAINHGGFTYIYVLIVIALIGAQLAMAGTVWHTEVKREKEAELLFIGHEFRQAIANFHTQTPGGEKRYPKTLEDLVLDPRFPQPVRHLRRIYRDPMTGQTEWGMQRNVNGDIVGIYSLSTNKPLKVGGFQREDKAFTGMERYEQWVFTPMGVFTGSDGIGETNASTGKTEDGT